MASKAQIEAAKKALEAGQGIGAAIDAAEAEAWQPIDTAPKSGTSILVYDGNGIFICSWYDDKWDVDHDVGGWEYQEGINATHWRPLPAPPKMED